MGNLPLKLGKHAVSFSVDVVILYSRPACIPLVHLGV